LSQFEGVLSGSALWVRIQTSLKNHKWATQAKEWPTHSSRHKNIQQQKFNRKRDKFTLPISLEKTFRKIQKYKNKSKIFAPTLVPYLEPGHVWYGEGGTSGHTAVVVLLGHQHIPVIPPTQ
jgi:hypothetical protein